MHETFAEELDSHVHLVLALLQFETTVLPDGVLANDARDGRFLGLLALSSVLLEHLGLGGCNELILLLSLRLLHDLADARVRVKDWLVFHDSLFGCKTVVGSLVYALVLVDTSLCLLNGDGSLFAQATLLWLRTTLLYSVLLSEILN